MKSVKNLLASIAMASMAIPATTLAQVTVADVLQLSDENNKYYYSIQDNRPATNDGPFYWTLGTHNNCNAIQASNENKTTDETEKAKQLFYFMAGSTATTFKIYTYDGQNVDYVEGFTTSGWNNGNTTTTTDKAKFMQYGTTTSGEFQIEAIADLDGYYGIRNVASQELLNDRGTANGAAANMKWVINTYANNTTGDSGSQYKFTLVEQTHEEPAFQLSDENNKYYYSIQDNRDANVSGPFFWTLGTHNNYKAIQASNENKTADATEKAKQLFYFMAGSTENTFKIYTYDGQNVDYVEGTAMSGWNTAGTTTAKFMQYGTATSGEFQIEKIAGLVGYYGIRDVASQELLNDRGTGNGAAANMAWVINTYNGNHTGDTGSQYKFTLVETANNSESTVGIESTAAEKPIFAMTREELHQTSDLRIFGIDGRQVPNVLTAAPGIYVVLKSGEAHKIFLK